MINLKRNLKRTKKFIRRLWHFLPALWNDIDYDYLGLCFYIKAKLELLEYELRYGISMHGPAHADKIREVISRIDKLIENDSCMSSPDEVKQDLNFVFNTIGDNIENWWD